MTNGRSREAVLRFTERRRREDEAPRLHAQVPRLASLRLEVEEHRGVSTVAETKHVRLVIVDNAPALFILPCGDPACRDGGHDITEAVMQHLQSGAAEFVVQDECMGNLRGAPCGRIVRMTAVAAYTA
jgi:hypothetical protein